MGALLAGLPNTVGGVTVNRFCASGLTALAMAADRIRVGESDALIAGGCESMSMVPMMGNKPSLSPHIFDRDENVGIAYGMGLTAERVAERWKISREAQDAYALESQRRTATAQQAELTFLRGLDNASYYTLVSATPQFYWVSTGVGTNLNAGSAAVRQLASADNKPSIAICKTGEW